jgi:xanthine dehydrogenase accessory factor
MRIPGLFITVVEKYQNSKISINRYWLEKSHSATFPRDILPFLDIGIDTIIKDLDTYGFRELKVPGKGDEPEKMIFIESVIPPPRLIIAGAGHIGKALSIIGRMLDFEITVIDDRREFANFENIPDADHIVNDDIGNAISGIRKGNDVYFVIVTRGHKDDGDALKACIGSDAAYVGMIGSRTKVALMRKEFVENGWATIEQWDKVFTPIGLDIKSKTVEEIAVSIAAQLIQVKNKSY